MARRRLTHEGPNFINESVIDEHIDKSHIDTST